MIRPFTLVFCALLLSPSLAGAEETGTAQSEEQWLVGLRNSATYVQGLQRAHEKIDFAYDLGAVAGAKHWDEIHEYYIELARAKGCKKAAPFAKGPMKACHEVSRPEPKIVGPGYEQGKARVLEESKKSEHPELVRKVLLAIYDHGYVQGLKHRGRANNDEMRWSQTFYKSCVSRAKDSEHEPLCASSSKRWSESLDARLRKQVRAHGLPVSEPSK